MTKSDELCRLLGIEAIKKDERIKDYGYNNCEEELRKIIDNTTNLLIT